MAALSLGAWYMRRQGAQALVYGFIDMTAQLPTSSHTQMILAIRLDLGQGVSDLTAKQRISQPHTLQQATVSRSAQNQGLTLATNSSRHPAHRVTVTGETTAGVARGGQDQVPLSHHCPAHTVPGCHSRVPRPNPMQPRSHACFLSSMYAVQPNTGPRVEDALWPPPSAVSPGLWDMLTPHQGHGQQRGDLGRDLMVGTCAALGTYLLPTAAEPCF